MIQIFILTGIIVYRQYWVATGERILLVTEPVDPRDIFRGDYVRLTYEISTLDLNRLGVSERFKPRDKIYVTLERDENGIYRASFVSKRRAEGKPFIQGRIKGVEPNARKWSIHVIDDSETIHLLEARWLDVRIGDRVTFCLDAIGRIWNYYKEDFSSPVSKCRTGKSLVGMVEEMRPIRFTELQVEYGIESYFVEEGRGREIESQRDLKSLKVEVSLRKDGRGTITALVMGKKVFH
jgi:uncharacterized membrane-anchored protein